MIAIHPSIEIPIGAMGEGLTVRRKEGDAFGPKIRFGFESHGTDREIATINLYEAEELRDALTAVLDESGEATE